MNSCRVFESKMSSVYSKLNVLVDMTKQVNMLYGIVALLGMIYCHAKAMKMSTNLNHKRFKNLKSVLHYFSWQKCFL